MMVTRSVIIIFALTTVFVGVSSVDIDEKKLPAVTSPVEEGVDETARIVHVGDIMLGRYVGTRIQNGVDPFLNVDHELWSYDMVVGNLEGPITDKEVCQNKAYSFKFATTTADLLAKHNIAGVTLANNHSFDCFSKGLSDTMTHLTDGGIFYFGGTSPHDMYHIQTVNGMPIAFVGIDRTISTTPLDDVYTLIETLSASSSSVVVHIHWGNEYETMYSTEQQNIAHALIDHGADLIIGSHPHVMQPAELYKGKVVFYSLGNFVFDQIDEETTQGYAVEMFLEQAGITYAVRPYRIIKTQPSFLSADESEKICKKILKNIVASSTCSFVVSK